MSSSGASAGVAFPPTYTVLVKNAQGKNQHAIADEEMIKAWEAEGKQVTVLLPKRKSRKSRRNRK
jgi:hypothetical protein